MPNGIVNDLDKLLGKTARMFAEAGDARIVAVLSLSEATVEQTSYDGWDGGQYGYTVTLHLPENLYLQTLDHSHYIGDLLKAKLNDLTRFYENEWIENVALQTEYEADEQWREKSRAWIAGKGISNQGRARSDNIAPRMCDGLLFRSQQEIYLYRALKAFGVTFAPLPVFIKGGATYRRIEPDFVILKDGVLMIVEVDGDTVHQETPVEAHNRTTMLVHEGAHVERVTARDCDTQDKARICAERMLEILKKLKGSR